MESETSRLHGRSSSDSPIFTRKKQTNLKSTTLSRAIKELRSQGKLLSPKSEREENSHSEMCPHYSSLLNKACPQRFCFTRAKLTWGRKLPAEVPASLSAWPNLRLEAQTQKHLWGPQAIFPSWQQVCGVFSKPFLHLPNINWVAYKSVLPVTRVNFRLYSLRAQSHKLPHVRCQLQMRLRPSPTTNSKVPRTLPHVC